MTSSRMTIRVLQVKTKNELNKIFTELKVEPYGIRIMLPKAINYLVRLDSLPSIAANILKQEMLSLGGDVALPKQALMGGMRKTECLLLGTLSQINRLNAKLKIQPFGLNRLAYGLSQTLNNYVKDEFVLPLGNHRINLGKIPRIMGIINLTADSFSADGLYQMQGYRRNPQAVLNYARELASDGADILDLGGESSRPGAKKVSLKEELNRTIPVIKLIAKQLKVPISIDTYKPEVAERALDNGAVMVNDITGFRNPKMRKIAAKYKAAAVIMHMQGTPATMQKNPVYQSLIDEIVLFLDTSVRRCTDAGIDRDKIIIDPGIGFGKTLKHNLEILKRLKEFKVLGRPILIGTSRKSFIGKILKAEPQERISGTIASCVLAAEGGASIVRVHDVKEVAQALRVSGAILN
jgi:dihydropteroate synthase